MDGSRAVTGVGHKEDRTVKNFTDALNAVLKYSFEQDRQTLHQNVLDNPDDRHARGVYADWLEDHDLASQDHLHRLRNEEERVRPVLQPNGQVTVHHWLAPHQDYSRLDKTIGSMRSSNDNLLDTGRYHLMHDMLAQTLDDHHDPRAGLVRLAGQQEGEALGGNPTPNDEAGPFHPYSDESDASSVLHHEDYVPLSDKTALMYNIMHHPDHGKFVDMHWMTPAGGYNAYYNPTAAQRLVDQMAPEHSEQFRQRLAGGAE